MNDHNLPVIGITMGDPVGIGPEIVTRALADPTVSKCCRPVLYGNPECLKRGARCCNRPCTYHLVESIADLNSCTSGTPLIDPDGNDRLAHLPWGCPTTDSGRAMAAYLDAAIEDAGAQRIDAVVTAPINKYALHMADIPFSGHTEILADRTGTKRYAMMLAGPHLKVVLATIHLPLQQVPQMLSSRQIEEIIHLTDQSLKKRFGIQSPRIAVAGLNPHAGEGGLFGDEETRLISPAIDSARTQGIAASGPHPPDTVFYQASRGAHDAVVAMYHDQGLGPFKMVHFEDGVNTTLGLPIIRTSVDHGTAYDIAGSGQASATSLVAAITMAADQVQCQRRWRHLP